MDIKKSKILFIDDDIRILSGYKRILDKDFDVKMAHDPIIGLKILKSEDDIAVIVSDFMMPKVDGNLLFEVAKDISPHSIRIMLSGNADLSTAVDAINKSAVYKLLIKPFPTTELRGILFDALKLYKKNIESKDIEDNVFLIASDIINDLVSMLSPRDGFFINSIVDTTQIIVDRLNYLQPKKIIIASYLSQLGFINMPNEIKSKVYNKKQLTKDEVQALEHHPEFAKKIVLKKAFLMDIANGISFQNKNFVQATSIKDKLTSDIAMVLRVSIDFTLNLNYYDSHKRAIKELKRNFMLYDPKILKVLEEYVDLMSDNYDIEEISPIDVKDGMIVARDFFNVSNELLITKGSVISSSLKLKLMTSCHFNMCKNKILVKVKNEGV
jgi:FixJ family two-component response regulator